MRKTADVGGVDREGRVRARVVRGATAAEIAPIVRDMVDTNAVLTTDEARTYNTVGSEYADHLKVKHSLGQYVRYRKEGTQVTTNRIGGFWAGLKRQIGGTHNAVSRKHLHRFVSEVEFKYNNRKLSDADRMVQLIQASNSRRFTYADQVKNHDEAGQFIYGHNPRAKTSEVQ